MNYRSCCYRNNHVFDPVHDLLPLITLLLIRLENGVNCNVKMPENSSENKFDFNYYCCVFYNMKYNKAVWFFWLVEIGGRGLEFYHKTPQGFLLLLIIR